MSKESRFNLFMAYAGGDVQAAGHLAEILDGSGIACFFHPTHAEAGSYATRIAQALDESACMAVVLSAVSARLLDMDEGSAIHLRNEIAAAQAAKLRIIPIYLDGIDPGRPLNLAQYEAVDGRDLRAAADRVVRLLMGAGGGGRGRGRGSVPPPVMLLGDLIASLYVTDHDVRMMAERVHRGTGLQLPGPPVALLELSWKLAALVTGYGVEAKVFARMKLDRPRRMADILATEREWLRSTTEAS